MEWLSGRRTTWSIFDEALRWVDEIKHGCADESQFLEWARRSPEHIEAFFDALCMWQDVQALSPQQRERIERLAQESRRVSSSSGNVVWLHTEKHDAPNQRSDSRPMPWIRRIGVVAGSLILAIGLLIFLRPFDSAYETGPAETRIVALPDGSRLHLNAQTRLIVRFHGHVRDLELARGEAMFDVAHDPARPFRVIARGVVSEALGTRFDTKLVGDQLLVTVTRGRVAVAADGIRAAGRGRIELTKGEQAAVQLGRERKVGVLRSLSDTESRAELAWTGALVLSGMTLREAIARFNYANTTQIVVDDPALGDLPLGGRFSLIDPEAFVNALLPLGIVASAHPGDPGVLHLMRTSGMLRARAVVPESAIIHSVLQQPRSRSWQSASR